MAYSRSAVERAMKVQMDKNFKRPFLWPELYRSPGRVVNSFSV